MRAVLSLVAVAILVVGCRSVEEPSVGRRPTVSVNSLVGTSWIAEDIDGRGVLERVQSTLTFVSLQQIAGRAACNQYFGSVEVKDGAPHLKPAGATRMACPPAVMEQETRFLNALGTVNTLRFDGVKLLLLDDSGRVRVRMSPMPPGPGASVGVPLQASAFSCAGGPTFVLVRVEDAGRPDGAIDLILGGGRRRLPRVPTASGERYADSGVSVWNKGQEATLDLNGRNYACVENRQRAVIEDARFRGV